jgi:hypothetical protein
MFEGAHPQIAAAAMVSIDTAKFPEGSSLPTLPPLLNRLLNPLRFKPSHGVQKCTSIRNLIQVRSSEDEQHRAPHSHSQILSMGYISVRGRVLRITPFLPAFLPFAGAEEVAMTLNSGGPNAPPDGFLPRM